jgi:serine/threonine-protein kinase
MIARFEREVQLTSALTHPIHHRRLRLRAHRRRRLLLRHGVPARIPLDRLIRDDGPQPTARVVHLVKQICASLAEAHRVGLVHRDVKPANAMLCERGGLYDVVKVLDFGLVKETASADASLTAAHHIVGTPALHGTGSRRRFDAGGCAQRRVRGGPGWPTRSSPATPCSRGKSGVDIIGHHLHSIPISPSERLGLAIDPFLENLILRCLAKKPDDRPADAGTLLREIEKGWTGGVWTQDEARAWWETKGAPMLDARRGTETAGSLGPNLEVDFDSRVASRAIRGDQRGHRDADGPRRQARPLADGGQEKRTIRPPPGLRVAPMRPPWASTIERHRDKADPQAVRLGREERDEEEGQGVVVHARAAVPPRSR